MTIPAELLTNLITSTEEVFETMVFKPLVRLPVVEHTREVTGAHVVATVAFAGHRRGVVAIHASLETARDIAGAMLGMPAASVDQEMPDAMGEVANMVAGTFRNKQAASEPPSNIAVPTVTLGSDFTTRYSQTVRRAECPFDMEGQRLAVELILIGDEPAAAAA